MNRPGRMRADELLVQKGLAPTRSQARILIGAGEVRTPDHRVEKAAEMLPVDSVLLLDEKPRFVSRGGRKLEAALDEFSIDPTGLVVADIGASTGGFTDCLLQRGATRVYAIDVGYGQLDYSLRRDSRVVVMERVNARYLEPLSHPIDLTVVDTSFISLKLILPAVQRIGSYRATIIALVKPQFEAGRDIVGRRGVVKDERVRARVVRDIIDFAEGLGMRFQNLMRSPLIGPAGNEEFLVHLSSDPDSRVADVDEAINRVF